jgi:hypothetical protein
MKGTYRSSSLGCGQLLKKASGALFNQLEEP